MRQASTRMQLRLWRQALAASLVAVGLSLVGYVLTHAGLSENVFLLVPFCTGLAIAFMSGGRMVVAITAATSLLLSLSILVFTGLEGIGCVLMALPILLVGIGMGAVIGYAIGKRFIHRYGNVTVVALCLAVMGVAGWRSPGRASPAPLAVSTTMVFDAPLPHVWDAVTAPGEIRGDGAHLRLLGLPVPQSCVLGEDGSRTCYFDTGEMRQQVVDSEFGVSFAVEIVDSLEVRDWLTFVGARYDFAVVEGGVSVTRTDTIRSQLRPRWYWEWFESRCVELEHRYVLGAMRERARASVARTGARPAGVETVLRQRAAIRP